MELHEAKNIVRQLAGRTFIEAIKIDNVAEAIRLVCEAAPIDEEAKIIQRCIPNEMAYMGLYPTIMKQLDYSDEVRNEIRFNMLFSHLEESLRKLQTIVIGIAKPKFGTSYESIIKKEGSLLTLIHIGQLLGSSTLSIEESECTVHYFPENKTLDQMMSDPINFDIWYKSNVL